MPTSAPKNEITNESIELDVADLLDIDGSDDQTVALSKKLAKLSGPKRNARVAAAAAAAPVSEPSEPEDNRATIPFGLEKHAPKPTPAASTVSAPAHLFFAAAPPKNPTPVVRDAGSTIEPVSSSTPAHFAARERKVSASYPPIAIAIAGHREKALSFIQERPSRAGWIAAAVIAVVLVIGGSIRVQSVAPAASAQPADFPPAPVVAFEQEAPKPVEAAPAKVVQFGDDQGVAIKSKSGAKHVAPPAKPAPKPASTPATAEKKPEPKPAAPEKKKPQSIDAELAEAQLRAAAR